MVGVPVGVLVAPIIPALNEKDVEAIIERAAVNGANSIGYTCIRLPHELKQLFREWLELHYPDRAAHIISLIQQMNGGKDYDANFATRMRGQGVFADIIRKRVQVATRKAGLDRAWDTVLDTSQFIPPRVASRKASFLNEPRRDLPTLMPSTGWRGFEKSLGALWRAAKHRRRSYVRLWSPYLAPVGGKRCNRTSPTRLASPCPIVFRIAPGL